MFQSPPSTAAATITERMHSGATGYCANMRKIRRLIVLGAGAAAAYFLDPSEGSSRRGRLLAYVKTKRNRPTQPVADQVDSPTDITVVIVTEPDAESVEPQVMNLS